jgi:hypothetical protein
VFGLKLKEPYCKKKYTYTDNEGYHQNVYQRKQDPVKEVIFTGIGAVWVWVMVDSLLLKLHINSITYLIIALCVMIVRVLTIVEKDVRAK